ncbi:MAG: hypothetical protein KJS92_09400, partial [Bacteroidetes bacterium]|nr:hypothetical protein [Bacteroidota bacterium]
ISLPRPSETSGGEAHRVVAKLIIVNIKMLPKSLPQRFATVGAAAQRLLSDRAENNRQHGSY